MVINEAGNEVGALVDVTEDGSGVASGEVYTDFNITGIKSGALVGSYLSAEVDVSGVLSGLGPKAFASVKASLEVKDTTADVVIAAETVVDDSIADGTIPVSGVNAVAMSLPLSSGHSYRVSLIIEAQAVGSPGDAAGAISDFVNTASWSGLSVTAGLAPFALIAKLDARVSELETDLDQKDRNSTFWEYTAGTTRDPRHLHCHRGFERRLVAILPGRRYHGSCCYVGRETDHRGVRLRQLS